MIGKDQTTVHQQNAILFSCFLIFHETLPSVIAWMQVEPSNCFNLCWILTELQFKAFVWSLHGHLSVALLLVQDCSPNFYRILLDFCYVVICISIFCLLPPYWWLLHQCIQSHIGSCMTVSKSVFLLHIKIFISRSVVSLLNIS